MNKRKRQMPSNLRKTLMRLFKYYKYHRFIFFTGLLLIVVSAGAQIAANGLLSPIIDTIIEERNMAAVLPYIYIMVGLVISISLGQYLGNLFLARVAQGIVHQIREDLFSHIQDLPVEFFDSRPFGDIMSSFTNDMDLLTQTLEQSVSQILLSLVTVVGTFSMMIFISPLLTLLVIFMLVIMFNAMKIIGKRSSRYYRERQKDLAMMNSFVEEMIGAQRDIKLFNYEERAVEDFDQQTEKLRESSTMATTYGVMMMPVMGNLSYVMYALVAVGGALLTLRSMMSIGNIASFLQYTRTISRPITQVSNQMNSILASIAGAERIFAVLDEEIEWEDSEIELVGDCVGKKDLCWEYKDEDGKLVSVPVAGDIRFNNVDFSYDGKRKVLEDISLYAKPGQRIAFVGSTGAGKTTITNLINRFYEIENGEILYDGINIKDIDKRNLRATMSMVLQDVHLFEGTIADNIRYGKLEATDEEIIKAAKIANVHDFIMQLKDGYDTYLGPGEGTLSNGERQLISIARAAIADPVILILDEATSSVDTRTELLIESGMNELMKGRTTFVIAHRLSTVRRANAIMVLEDGEIVERGDHDELMEAKGLYYCLNMGTAELD